MPDDVLDDVTKMRLQFALDKLRANNLTSATDTEWLADTVANVLRLLRLSNEAWEHQSVCVERMAQQRDALDRLLASAIALGLDALAGQATPTHDPTLLAARAVQWRLAQTTLETAENQRRHIFEESFRLNDEADAFAFPK